MINLPFIQLNDDWVCDYFEIKPDLYEFATGERLTDISAWSFDKRRVDGWAAWLQREFVITAVDYCVKYFLLIDQAPHGARIYVNGTPITTYTVQDDDPPFEFDITHFIALGDNTLAFRVEGMTDQIFSGVRLQGVPCE